MRTYWTDAVINSVVSLSVNAVLASTGVYFFASSSEFTSSFMIIFIFLILAPLLFSLKNILVTTITSWLGYQKMRETMLIEFKRSKMPVGEHYFYWDADEYFIQVAQNVDEGADPRMKAVEISSQLNALRRSSWVYSMFLTSATNAALRDHFSKHVDVP